MRISRAGLPGGLAAAVLLGGLAAAVPAAQAAAPYSCTVSTANGMCPAGGGGYTSYAGFSDFSGYWLFGSPYVGANMWAPVTGETQTVSANSPADWQVNITIPPGSNPSGAVTTYPNAGMDLGEQPLTSFGDITSHVADTVPSDSSSVGWQGYDLWFNSWGDEEMIQTNFINASPCAYVAVQQFGGQNGVPVQTWGLCNFGGPGGEKVWHLAPSGTQVGGSALLSEPSGTVDVSAMTQWLVSNGYMLTATGAATTMTALSAGFEITETPGAGSAWTYSDLTFVNNTGTTTGQAPAVVTSAASGVTGSAATLNGTVNPEGQAATYTFDYGTTAGYGTSAPVPAGPAGSGSTAVNESASLTGLTPSTTYHYRIEAANATGTTLGADQQFTTAAPPASVAYDSTGPSSAGAKKANSGTLSWTHAVGSGTHRALLAEVAVGSSNDVSCGLTLKDNGVTMTKLAIVHDNNQDAGYFDVFGVANPATGANVLAATVTSCQGGTPLELTGGSESFTGVSQAAPFGTPVNAFGSGALASATVPGTNAGNMVAGFAANGSSVTSAASPAASRYIANQDGLTGAGNSAGATAPAGGSVTMSWNVTSDWWGASAVQVQAG